MQHNFHTLLVLSKLAHEADENQVQQPFSFNFFQKGAIWMAEKMNDLEPQNKVFFDKKTPFNTFGFLKYGACLIAFLVFFLFFFNKNIFFTPFSVLIFYFFEVHFLFLFPLLIDKIPNPIWKSIKTTYKVGVFRAIFIVIQIAFFMLIGIFYFKKPLKNWYIGCLCILIWYKDEVRNRL